MKNLLVMGALVLSLLFAGNVEASGRGFFRFRQNQRQNDVQKIIVVENNNHRRNNVELIIVRDNHRHDVQNIRVQRIRVRSY